MEYDPWKNFRERLLARGYEVIYYNGEYFIYTANNTLMGCGYSESEAWAHVSGTLSNTLRELIEEVDNIDQHTDNSQG